MANDSKSQVVIRQFRPDETEAIIAITQEVFGPVAIEGFIQAMLGPANGHGWIEIKAGAIRRELASCPEACFVAEMDGQIVGYVTNTIDRTISRGVIANLAVRKVCQSRGVGRGLLERSLEYFRSIGLSQAKIETLACNEVGQHLYPSLGFREVARQIHYIMPL